MTLTHPILDNLHQTLRSVNDLQLRKKLLRILRDERRKTAEANAQLTTTTEASAESKMLKALMARSKPKSKYIPANLIINAISRYPQSATLQLPDLYDVLRLQGTEVISIPVARTNGLPELITYADVSSADCDFTNPEIAAISGQTVPANILTSYGVNWTPKKISRDIWQNFYDGHNQTLSGVRMKISKASDNEPYKVCIEGGAEYPYDLLTDLGATTKSDSTETAGHFGEGAKIVPLLLLRDIGANNIRYASSNWQLDFSLVPYDFDGTQELCFTLRPITSRRSGNSLQFETNDPHFVYLLIKGIEYFASSFNQDLAEPSYANAIGGFKFLPDDYGNIYIGGQRYQLRDQSEGWDKPLESFTIWSNKTPASLVPDRDRSGIRSSELAKHVLKPMIQMMTDHEIIALIFKLKLIWSQVWLDDDIDDSKLTAIQKVMATLLKKDSKFNPIDALVNEAIKRKLTTTFPDSCIAAGEDLNKYERALLQRLGFTIYNHKFAQLGMVEYGDQFTTQQMGKALKTTIQERYKLNIVKQAALLFAEMSGEQNNLLKSILAGFDITKQLISKEDIDKPIYLFDATKSKMFKHQSAVFAKDRIWFDRGFLKSASLDEVLCEYLGALMLRYGSEESEASSYAITDIVQLAIRMILSTESAIKLNHLKQAWQELSKGATA